MKLPENIRNAFIGPLAGIVRGGVSKAESTYEIRTWPGVGLSSPSRESVNVMQLVELEIGELKLVTVSVCD
jgi:hypothetical protein